MAQSDVVKINDIEMEYCRFGSGKRLFVILPGLSIQSVIGAKDAIEQGFSEMNGDFTTYVFDRRKNISEGYSIYDMADDTVAVIKELGLKDINIFGASQGGMIALVIGIKYPEIVRTIILGSTSAHVKPEQRAVIDTWIELAKKKDCDGLCQSFAKNIYPADVYEQLKDSFSEMAKVVTDEELERFTILAEAIKDFDVSSKLKEIKCPVLAIGAFEDEVLDSDATMEIAENLDYRNDFSLYMYTGYGHAVFDTAPDYRKRVYDFMMKEDH